MWDGSWKNAFEIVESVSRSSNLGYLRQKLGPMRNVRVSGILDTKSSCRQHGTLKLEHCC